LITGKWPWVPYRDIELRGLLDGVLADEVLVKKLVGLGGHLFIWLMKRSRKTPEQDTATSTRGRPSTSRGMSSTLLTRPSESDTGRFVLMTDVQWLVLFHNYSIDII
jgi:hypothetical protein